MNRDSSYSNHTWKWIFSCLILFGCLIKFFDLDSPFRRKDHYNWGNVQHTRLAKCLLVSPISESKGIPHYSCKDNKASSFYPNHPPTIIWMAAGWMKVLGTQAEWSIRLLFILFSILNVCMVFKIARFFSHNDLLPWAAAAIQAIFPFGMYYGSHFDYISEASTFFVLLAAFIAMKGYFFLAHFMTLISGLVSWAGFFGFAALNLYSLIEIRKSKLKLVASLLFTLLAAFVGLWLMAYLHQGYSLPAFLHEKIINPGYAPKESLNLTYPFVWISRWIQTHARFLSAILASFMVLEVWVRISAHKENSFKERLNLIKPWAYLLSPGLLFMVLGHQFVYLHSFQYGYLVPAYSILVGSFITRLIDKQDFVLNLAKTKAWTAPAIFLLLYPYGMYKNIIWLDVINSLSYLLVTITFFIWWRQGKIDHLRIVATISIIAVINSLQMINWRSEPALDAEFCAKAKLEYEKTGQPVKTSLDDFWTRTYYCGDIPLIYEPGSGN